MFQTTLSQYPFTGLPNTRDLGGLPAADGRHVRPGVLLRSTTLERASDHDRALLLERWNLKTVIDLRTPEEQEREPYDRSLWPGVTFADCPVLKKTAAGVTREGAQDSKESLKALGKFLQPRKLMNNMYSGLLVREGALSAYTGFFATLLQHNGGAALWHCTMGKDRAGLATVLLLFALGVPFERIQADYLATNDYLAASPVDENLRSAQAFQLPAAMARSFKVLNGVEAEYLERALASAKAQFGDMDTYLEQALGVGPQQRAALQEKFLE